MLYLVGLGLGDARDITVRGLEIVRAAHSVFLESYTSILTVDRAALVSDGLLPRGAKHGHVLLGCVSSCTTLGAVLWP